MAIDEMRPKRMAGTRARYEAARVALTQALTQLEPNGRSCAICEDNGHQAFECRFNPVLAMQQRDDLMKMIDNLHDELHRRILPRL